MKRVMKLLAVLAFLSVMFMACGSTPPPKPVEEEKPVVEEPVEEEPVVEEEEPAPEPEPEPVVEESTDVSTEEYIVVKGDTLSQIALKFYGTRKKAYYFPIIMATNPGLIKHPDKLTPKMKLLIPNYEEFMANAESRESAKPEFEKCIEIYRSEGRPGVVGSLQKRLEEL